MVSKCWEKVRFIIKCIHSTCTSVFLLDSRASFFSKRYMLVFSGVAATAECI
jgi:hypothetical protein